MRSMLLGQTRTISLRRGLWPTQQYHNSDNWMTVFAKKQVRTTSVVFLFFLDKPLGLSTVSLFSSSTLSLSLSLSFLALLSLSLSLPLSLCLSSRLSDYFLSYPEALKKGGGRERERERKKERKQKREKSEIERDRER